MSSTETASGILPVASFTSQLVAALDGAWAAIQARHPEVPDVVLTIGSGTLGLAPEQARWGHFAAERWQRASDEARRVPELFIGGEGLARGAAAVLGTLLHEAAHGIADARGVQDTSRQGRYHNTRFRVLAEELGLVVEQHGRHGWSVTRVPPSTGEAYTATLRGLEAALTAWRHAEPTSSGTAGKRKGNGVVARCECGRQFRITTSVLELGPIVCGVCDQPFENTTPDAGDEHQDQQ